MIRYFGKWLFRHLSVASKYEIFYQTARALGIRGYLLDGGHGAFLGAVGDRAIMRTYLLQKKWSTEILGPVVDVLAGGGTFVDVGANIGLIALEVARVPDVKVIALEPDDENFSFLEANIALHGVTNVTAMKAAAWSEDTELQFSRNNYNSGDHHVDASGPVSVRAVRLDQLLIEPGALVVKIDTQGAEPSVLAGATALMRRANLIILEFWPWGMLRMGLKPADAIESLRQLGFGGNIIRHGIFEAHMDPDAMIRALTDYAATPSEYQSIDVMLSPQADLLRA